MITNIPTASDFEKLAGECLNQAFSLIYDIDYDKELIEEQDISIREVWRYNQGTLRTSIVLVHQGLEAFMKSVICSVSPLLLIENKRTEWPTTPDTQSKDFSDLYTIGAEALMYTFCAVAPQMSTPKIVQLIEKVRKQRNLIVHGIASETLLPMPIIEMILDSFAFFKGKDAWWSSMRTQFIQDPLFGLFDTEYEIASFGRRLDYLRSRLSKTKLSKFFTQDMKAREYFCPDCKSAIENNEGESLESKWAYLRPNEPNSTTIFCLSCQKTFNVSRSDCTESDFCKGNVIYENDNGEFLCLTCGEEQQEEL